MSYHKDVVNFGREEANRMALTRPDPWADIEQWLHTVTGQEFCDELVWGTVGIETLNAILRENGIAVSYDNRQKLVKLANEIMADDGA